MAKTPICIARPHAYQYPIRILDIIDGGSGDGGLGDGGPEIKVDYSQGWSAWMITPGSDSTILRHLANGPFYLPAV